MTFQRARNEEQREIRRRAILDTATAMLDEMPMAEVSLNELSRRVGLAKSNVLRYFESREAVLLELLDAFLERWLAELADELAAGVEAQAAPDVRADQLARILSRSLAERVVLCDLLGGQGGVLEHNVSTDVIKQHKRASLARLETMAGLVRRHLPEIGDGAQLFCLMSLVSAGALSTYVPPPPSLVAACADEPALAVFQMDLCDALQYSFTAGLLGVLPRR
ncbi:TetR family transcriptional regulator [Mycolicibacterium arabiense]|uniref:TetR family transcriptional regulator n=1 Tax=Mycolicibacterium arabiense TaxID=1286181 RepID=A0A7I7S2G9_9MYCO|nr:TetR/AcrR family transcriptional regulator [Mycolicibacterium arabiense]MCV7371720.1 TetR/AcrR family transcriptional regulator [Mycolicibacterium arabiense]BBY50429.1 TetR family transcriptional regulator [Mycolicibacterium arabiense]